MRYAKARDANEPAIVAALERVGCLVERGTDIDLYVSRGGRGYLLEVKRPKRATECRMQRIQKWLREHFSDQYHIVQSAEEALKAVGL